jgi:hypothetical protein
MSFISIFSIPDESQQDKHSCLTAKFWKEISRLISIEYILTTIYYQNTNSQLEQTKKINSE